VINLTTTSRRTGTAGRSCRSSSPSRPTVRPQHHPALLRHQPDDAGPRGVPIFGRTGASTSTAAARSLPTGHGVERTSLPTSTRTFSRRARQRQEPTRS
jgi:hypothetical protein